MVVKETMLTCGNAFSAHVIHIAKDGQFQKGYTANQQVAMVMKNKHKYVFPQNIRTIMANINKTSKYSNILNTVEKNLSRLRGSSQADPARET